MLSFIRSAHKDFDNELRIHADNIIQGHKTALASVFYITGDDVGKNGTAFYHHVHYGRELPENISDKDFDKLIKEDSGNIDKWILKDIITAQPNRLLTYKSNYFHSKYPSKITNGTRKVMVSFYKKV